MTLFENWVEPFTDLSQWNVVGSVGSDPYVAGGNLFFPVHMGETYDREIHETTAYDLTNSWVSFRIKATGSYNQGIVSYIGTEEGPIFVLNDYPGHPGMTFNLGPDLVTIPINSQPLIIIYADSSTATYAYSLDEAVTWTTMFTRSLSAVTASGLSHFQFGVYPLFAAVEDYFLEYSDINQFNLDGPVLPPVTQVDAAPLIVQWNFETFYLRHSTRHLHKTVFDYLSNQLATLGWTVDGDVPFDAPTVRLQEELPDEWDSAKVLKPGTVAITLGDENEAKNQELGGPLALIQVPLFIDVFMDTPGTTLALALDVRDIFTGRLPGTVRFLDVYDYSPNTPAIAQGYRMEFEDVIRQNVKKNWEVVKITAMLYFPDSEGN